MLHKTEILLQINKKNCKHILHFDKAPSGGGGGGPKVILRKGDKYNDPCFP